MRVILDTNVLVAAPIVSDAPPHQLFEAFLNDRFILITSDTQIEELSRVTRYPAIRSRIHPAQAGRLVNAVRSISALLEKLPPASVSRDPHDDYLFAMARAGEADYLDYWRQSWGAGSSKARQHGNRNRMRVSYAANVPVPGFPAGAG